MPTNATVRMLPLATLNQELTGVKIQLLKSSIRKQRNGKTKSRTAIEQNYCAYSNLLSDPLLRALHSDRRFGELLASAHACQQAVLKTGTPQDGQISLPQ